MSRLRREEKVNVQDKTEREHRRISVSLWQSAFLLSPRGRASLNGPLYIDTTTTETEKRYICPSKFLPEEDILAKKLPNSTYSGMRMRSCRGWLERPETDER